MTTEQLYQLFRRHPLISTDTRKIVPGSIFFALKGDNFDANTFAAQAVSQGAAFAVIDNAHYCLSQQFILVNDVLAALQDLARHHRRQFTIPVIGLTGSNGKTTTKELINAVLSQRFNVLATAGNLNNHIGVPLTVLSINNQHQAAIIEMGANHQREIELLCSIAQPNYGLITNIGRAHLEGFGGPEGVKKGKGELYDYLQHVNGTAFIDAGNSLLMEMQADRQLSLRVFYGDIEDAIVSGKITANTPYLSVQWTDHSDRAAYTIGTQLTGAYNLPNILAAVCAGKYFNLTAGEINTGVTGYQPGNSRSQVVNTTNNTLICDYYNANPSSMIVAIDNVSLLAASQKVLILADMFEMGDAAAAEHRFIIDKAMEAQVHSRIFIGPDFYGQQADADNALFFKTVGEAVAYLNAHPLAGATILLKGSRGMALERLTGLF